MKKTFAILSISLLLAACGGSTTMDTNSDDSIAQADHIDVIEAETVRADTAAIIAPAVKKDSVAPPITPEGTAQGKPVVKVAEASGSAKGGELLKTSDCLACHKEDVKLVGPAYKDVAKKYKPTAENIDKLADKVIKGGAGVWGEIPMSPHAGLSKSDAKEMVKYILALK
ncbi:MAG: c-type cytochrome [Mucilaginibacter sp.]